MKRLFFQKSLRRLTRIFTRKYLQRRKNLTSNYKTFSWERNQLIYPLYFFRKVRIFNTSGVVLKKKYKKESKSTMKCIIQGNVVYYKVSNSIPLIYIGK